MREIGGFFELELNQGKMYHENTMAFNSGANALQEIEIIIKLINDFNYA